MGPVFRVFSVVFAVAAVVSLWAGLWDALNVLFDAPEAYRYLSTWASVANGFVSGAVLAIAAVLSSREAR